MKVRTQYIVEEEDDFLFFLFAVMGFLAGANCVGSSSGSGRAAVLVRTGASRTIRPAVTVNKELHLAQRTRLP